jgi:DNA-binding response OmpR family regulator
VLLGTEFYRTAGALPSVLEAPIIATPADVRRFTNCLSMRSPSDPDPPDADLCGRVLYIEDVDVNYVVVEGGLACYPGVQLIRAITGAEGVRRVRDEHPDFVLLDMHLPDISGLEVVRQLSEDIATRRLRVTILTGDELTMDVIKAMSLGAFEYWIKPVNVGVLKEGVRRALTGKRADPARTLAAR